MRMIVRSGASAAAAMILSVGLAAQTTPQTGSLSAANTITVTGCIQRAATGTTGTSGTTGAMSSEAKFVLDHAVAANAASPTGTAVTTPPAPVASTYRLNADDAKLTPHVGHKVEISGTVDAKVPMTTPDASASSSKSPASGPTLKVETVKMLAASCSE